MTANCPTCEGTGETFDATEICEVCDGTGYVEGTKEELFSLFRWGASIVLLVLHTLLEVIR